MVNKFKTVLLVIIIFGCYTPAAYALEALYKEAHIVGKIITPDIIYGSLYYLDKDLEYKLDSAETYFQVLPLYPRHYSLLTDNLGKTVKLHGEMGKTATQSGSTFIYHDIEQVNYEIDLQNKYYYSTIQNVESSYGIELENEKALKDLIVGLQPLSFKPEELEINLSANGDLLKSLFTYRNKNLRYQSLFAKNNEISTKLRGQIDNCTFLIGTEGNNILVEKVNVNCSDILLFMETAKKAGSKAPEHSEKPMTIFGKVTQKKDHGESKYYITGVTGYSLEHWLENFKNENLEKETWLYKKPNSLNDQIGKYIWASGNRHQETNPETGKKTGKWYFTANTWLTETEFINGLNNFSKLTSGELVF